MTKSPLCLLEILIGKTIVAQAKESNWHWVVRQTALSCRGCTARHAIFIRKPSAIELRTVKLALSNRAEPVYLSDILPR